MVEAGEVAAYRDQMQLLLVLDAIGRELTRYGRRRAQNHRVNASTT